MKSIIFVFALFGSSGIAFGSENSNCSSLPNCSVGGLGNYNCTDWTGKYGSDFVDGGCSITCPADKAPQCQRAGCELDSKGRTTGRGVPASCECL